MYKYFVVLVLLGINLNVALAAPTTYSVDLESGSSQSLSISDASQTGLDITGDLTIEAWIKLESHPGTDNAYTIAGKHNGDLDQSGYMVVYEKTSGDVNRLRYDVYSNGESGTQCIVNHTLNANQWYHIALVYQAGTGTCEFFVDGSSVGTDDSLATSIYNNTAPFRIGSINSSSIYYFDGQIDDVRVWSKTRTQYDILNSMFGSVNTSDPNLEGYWKLSDLNDESSNNNDLTNNGSATFSGEPAHISQCRVWGVF